MDRLAVKCMPNQNKIDPFGLKRQVGYDKVIEMIYVRIESKEHTKDKTMSRFKAKGIERKSADNKKLYDQKRQTQDRHKGELE